MTPTPEKAAELRKLRSDNTKKQNKTRSQKTNDKISASLTGREQPRDIVDRRAKSIKRTAFIKTFRKNERNVCSTGLITIWESGFFRIKKKR